MYFYFVLDSTVLKSPTKKKLKGEAKRVILDDFDLGVLRRTIHEMYTVEHKVPSLNELVTKMKEKVNFTGGRETLRKQLIEIGFRYTKCCDKRKLLMERNDIVAWRSRFLRKIKENESLGANKKPVTYLDETFIHPNYGVGKCWQSDNEPGVYKSERSGQRYIVVHAGGSYGFVENSLLIFKSKTKSGDYHDEMNHDNFMRWLEHQLIPNLPPNGIVVMDNAPYHTVQINKKPTRANKKADIRTWLENNDITTTHNMRKAELLELVNKLSITKTYYVDELLKQHGHTVVRLPPYHCDLNPIELIWSVAKRKVAMNNVDQKNANIENLLRTAFAEITPDVWEKECNHVLKLGDKMWENDGLMDDIENSHLIFSVNTGSSDEEFYTSDEEFFN